MVVRNLPFIIDTVHCKLVVVVPIYTPLIPKIGLKLLLHPIESLIELINASIAVLFLSILAGRLQLLVRPMPLRIRVVRAEHHIIA